MFRHSNFVEFTQSFGTDEQCFAYLCEVKWKKGYQCRKCKHEKFVKGRTWYYRKCQKCQFDESCTSNTLFHKLKFPITKAFWIVYQVGTMKKGLSTMEISRQFGIHQKTAWFFKRKIQQAIQNGEVPKLKENVEVDETSVGGFEEGAPGRTKGKKRIVQVAIEVEHTVESGQNRTFIKNAGATVIEGYTSTELAKGIEKMLEPNLVVTTDKWQAYENAVGERILLQFLSNKGQNFQELHYHIFNLKNWIRGTHHHISRKHLQAYLDEYHYRFNRRNNILSCPSRLISRFVRTPWLAYAAAIGN